MLIEQILVSTLVLTTPILLAAMGGLVNRQAGIVNIGLEAKMLAGAFVAVIVSSATQSWLLACLAAALTGAGIGWVFSLTITRARANMIVAGLGLNVLVAGAIGFILAWVFSSSGTLRQPDVVLLPHILPQAIDRLPVIGPALADLDPLTLLSWATVLALPFLLANTRAGLWIRATGNAPQVIRALGLDGPTIQDASTAFAGAFAGLAGAHLALASLGLFNEGLTAGRGFIALAAFYFGRDRPFQTAMACLLFGFLDASQIRLQTTGFPPKLIGMIPYLMVLLALIFTSIRAKRKTMI
ncbi:ABC transporter permease [Rhodophyticola sp. CCM32]|uniref:ABC transporter permease n=1 Tax=Rhodophyticola sp. CCM32 TaxID=2916397 RepID=UPI001AEF87CB|nr:ABC transporter permease [Rhodophyticola sp. CCM32]